MRIGSRLSLTWLVSLIWLRTTIASAQEFTLDNTDLSADLYKIGEVDEEAIRTAFRRVKRDTDIQFDLDFQAPPPPQETPGWIEAIGRFIARIIDFLAPFLTVIFWLGLAALACVILYGIATNIIEARLKRAGPPEVPDAVEYKPEREKALILLDSADALAREGRFAEAVHMLLFKSIQDIEAQAEAGLRRSLTSREIAKERSLGPKTRTLFSALSERVEHSHFGGRSVNEAGYKEARALYVTFSEIEEWVASPARARSVA